MKVQILYHFNERQRQEIFARPLQKLLTSTCSLLVHLLKSVWFPDGFHGAMAELLCAIEEHREPEYSALNNLRSLAICFAALQSAEQHEPVIPGSVHKLIM